MKFIKYFESVSVDSYWKIPNTKPELLVALDKLKNEYGCDITEFDLYHIWAKKPPTPKFNPKRELYIILQEFGNTGMKNWYFSDKKRKVRKYKYNGEIIITTEDIERYELKKITNKYNL